MKLKSENFKIDLEKVKNVHLIGIGGIGVSAVAKFFVNLKKIVKGSEIDKTNQNLPELQSIGVKLYLNHSTKNISGNEDLIIHSTAIPKNNKELLKAKKLNIPVLSYPEFLGILSKKFYTIAVSGMHGKSTTTAIIGYILEKAGKDPLIIFGSKFKNWNGNLRFPKNFKKCKYFVVEACEYEGNFKYINPKIIVLTNIDKEHLDFFKNIYKIKKIFSEYIKSNPKAKIIWNKDDNNLNDIMESINNKNISCSIFEKSSNLKIDKIDFNNKCFFIKNKKYKLKIPGIYNIQNAILAIATAKNLKINYKKIYNALNSFPGIWRRLEILKKQNPIIFTDYAHHPTEITAMITAIRTYLKNKRLVLIFQPHQIQRTKLLFNEFVNSLELADIVIALEIYYVKGRERKIDISSKDLVKELTKRGTKSYFCKNFKILKNRLDKLISIDDVVIFAGAGDIDNFARNYVKLYAKFN